LSDSVFQNTTSGSPKKKLPVLRRLFPFCFKENIWKIRQKDSRQLPVHQRRYASGFTKVFYWLICWKHLKFCHWKICQIDSTQLPVQRRLASGFKKGFSCFFHEKIWFFCHTAKTTIPKLKYPHQFLVPRCLNFRFASTSDLPRGVFPDFSIQTINLICTKVKIYQRITKSVCKKMFDCSPEIFLWNFACWNCLEKLTETHKN